MTQGNPTVMAGEGSLAWGCGYKDGSTEAQAAGRSPYSANFPVRVKA